MISSFVRALVSAFKAHRKLALENVALRQQLAVLRRSVKRTRLSNVDRVFWVVLRKKSIQRYAVFLFWVYADSCGLKTAFLGNGGRNAATIFSLRYSSSR